MPGGSKGKYRRWLEPDGLMLLQGWARQGLTDEDIAKKMGITGRTLYRWKQQYCQICQALKKGKDFADIEVENALHKSAMGFTGPDGKYYAPNMTAAIFWLKNRKPNVWRDRPKQVEEDDARDGAKLLANILEKAWGDEKMNGEP